MEKDEHTPGPWEVVETDEGHEIRMGSARDNYTSYRPHHVVRCDHELDPDEDDGEARQYREACANARLLAAAPLLLTALHQVEWGWFDPERSCCRCPRCAGIQVADGGRGHEDDCTLAAAIREATGG